MQTTKWGPSAWQTFFIFSRNYPEEYDHSNKEHRLTRTYTKRFYSCLPHILPCKYCRESFKGFWKTLPIDDYLGGRNELTYWLYLIKDMVNKKLIIQEQKLFEEKLDSLKNKSKENIKKLKKQVFFTKPSPPFCDVVEYYEQFRAGCSEKTKSCRLKLKKGEKET